MADFSITRTIQYFGGSLRDENISAESGVITNNLAGINLTSEDALFVSANNELFQFGEFFGATTIGGSTFIVIYLGQEVGNDIYILAGPNSPDFASLPENFSDLVIDQTPFTVCFLSGTMIATPAGERSVETLAVGDLVLTADGRAAPVRWIGVQTVVSMFADPHRSFPVRIMAGAFGEGLPTRDLLVSPDHALFLEGVLVQAGALVNGTTIVRQTAMPERFTWFHVELEDHALILAEGVPAETFVDTVTRRRFDNFADYEARYGDTGPVLAELPAPRIKSARQLPAVLRERLVAGAEAGSAAVAAA